LQRPSLPRYRPSLVQDDLVVAKHLLIVLVVDVIPQHDNTTIRFAAVAFFDDLDIGAPSNTSPTRTGS